MSQWLIIHKGPDWHVWPLGDDLTDDELQDLIMRARCAVEFPDGDDWVKDIAQTTIQVTHGEPHPTMLARATVHDRGDLKAVDPAALTTYRGRCAAAARRVRLDAARAAMTLLSVDELAQLLAELPPRPTSGGPR